MGSPSRRLRRPPAIAQHSGQAFMTWDGYLDPADTDAIVDALIAEDVTTRDAITALLADLPAEFAAGAAAADISAPADFHKTTIERMRHIRNLRTGEVPLRMFLSAAARLAQDADHTALFLDMAEKTHSTPGPSALRGGGTLRGGAGDALPGGLSLDRANLRPEAKIGGRDETVLVDFLAKGEKTARSVFKIIVARHFGGQVSRTAQGAPVTGSGTAWVFAPGVGITNHHVFEARDASEPQADAADYRAQAETAMLIADYRDKTQNQTDLGSVLGADALLYADRGLDFALFRLPQPVRDRAPLALCPHALRKHPDQRISDRVNILQHPNGSPMKLGFRNNYVVQGDDNLLAYLTDTDTGSSGSPVMEDDWRVLALHAFSAPISVKGLTIMGTEIHVENVGVQIAAIRAHLQQNAPDLSDQLFRAAD